MCLSQWAFCNISMIPGMKTWKKYYLHRSKLETHMLSGQPAVDYTSKAMRGHEGMPSVTKNMDIQFLERTKVCSFSPPTPTSFLKHYVLCFLKWAEQQYFREKETCTYYMLSQTFTKKQLLSLLLKISSKLPQV